MRLGVLRSVMVLMVQPQGEREREKVFIRLETSLQPPVYHLILATGAEGVPAATCGAC